MTPIRRALVTAFAGLPYEAREDTALCLVVAGRPTDAELDAELRETEQMAHSWLNEMAAKDDGDGAVLARYDSAERLDAQVDRERRVLSRAKAVLAAIREREMDD